MTDDATTLPVIARRHRWKDEGSPTPVRDPKSGNDIRKRVCIHCEMTRVTVIPPQGDAWHEWITKDGKPWKGEATPPCLERVTE